jgi:hypothetical protein
VASVLPDDDYWARLQRAVVGFIDLLMLADETYLTALDDWENEGGACRALFD